jgi:hypothetical protein
VLPLLLEGSWAANAQALSVLIADAELIGDLSAFYGRVEELRWRLRYQAESTVPAVIEAVGRRTMPLVEEMRDEVRDLIPRVEQQKNGQA